MEELTLLGVIYIIVGVVLSLIIFITLILALVGIILLFMGKQNISHVFARYPMYRLCASCGGQIDPSSEICPVCHKPTTIQARPGIGPSPEQV